MTRLLLFSGMTDGGRIFRHQVEAIPNATVVPWLAPKRRETLNQYAHRLADFVRTDAPCFVGGVSFGGIVALEVACLVGARTCFLISSVRSPSELPPAVRFWRLLGRLDGESILQIAGAVAITVPRVLRTPSTIRLRKMAGQKGSWQRWATSAVIRWKPNPEIRHLHILHLHGDSDKTFPIKYVRAHSIVKNGGHLLPLTHPQAVTEFLIQGMQHAA